MNSHIQLQHEQHMANFGSAIYLSITTPSHTHRVDFFSKTNFRHSLLSLNKEKFSRLKKAVMKAQRKILQNFCGQELKSLETKYYSQKVFTLNIHKVYIFICKEFIEMDEKIYKYFSIYLSKTKTFLKKRYKNDTKIF